MMMDVTNVRYDDMRHVISLLLCVCVCVCVILRLLLSSSCATKCQEEERRTASCLATHIDLQHGRRKRGYAGDLTPQLFMWGGY